MSRISFNMALQQTYNNMGQTPLIFLLLVL
jgi:hypothetical protein